MSINCPFRPIDKVIYAERIKLNQRKAGTFTMSVDEVSQNENIVVSKVLAIGENVTRFTVGEYICTSSIHTQRQYFDGQEYMIIPEPLVLSTVDSQTIETYINN